MQQNSLAMRPACTKNAALPFHPRLLLFQHCGKCVGQGEHLPSFSNFFMWCILHVTLFVTDGKSAINQSTSCINLHESGHILCGVSCLSIMVHLTALHAMLYFQQVYTHKFMECYLCMCKHCVHYHEVHKGHVVALGEKKKCSLIIIILKSCYCSVFSRPLSVNNLK